MVLNLNRGLTVVFIGSCEVRMWVSGATVLGGRGTLTVTVEHDGGRQAANRKIQEEIETIPGEANIKRRGDKVSETKVALWICRSYRQRRPHEGGDGLGREASIDEIAMGREAAMRRSRRRGKKFTCGEVRFSIPWNGADRAGEISSLLIQTLVRAGPWNFPPWVPPRGLCWDPGQDLGP